MTSHPGIFNMIFETCVCVCVMKRLEAFAHRTALIMTSLLIWSHTHCQQL